jgi:hypothetical protein
MGYRISLDNLKEILSNRTFENDGDSNEKKYWSFLKTGFPNAEIFWRNILVPITKRIEIETVDPNERIRTRDGVTEDLRDIATFQYSMFLNLAYAYEHLLTFGSSSFENFYMHLASACDLAERFLTNIYTIILECTGEKSEAMEKMTGEEFMEVVKSWYRDYSKQHDHSYNKTEIRPFNLGTRAKALKEFFKNSNDWRDYYKHSNAIRAYRNVITHSVKIASLPYNDEIIFVPKKEKIQIYKRWEAVLQASSDLQKLKTDFMNARHQMKLDIELLEDILNKLWLKPLKELKRLFFDENNIILLQKYNIDLLCLAFRQP